MTEPFKLTFSNGLMAHAIQVHNLTELSTALRKLGLHRPGPTLVLVGGASGLSDVELSSLRPLFIEVLAPLAVALDGAVVDGGTDAGVMQLMGQARTETAANFPLVGVAAAETVVFPDTASPRPDAAPLEPNHTHFVFVPGSDWGDESLWLARVASVLANGRPSVTVLVNGGEITWEDVTQSVKAGRPVVVITGSGRVADTLAAALRGEATNRQAKELATSGLVQAINPTETEGSDTLARMIKRILSAKE